MRVITQVLVLSSLLSGALADEKTYDINSVCNKCVAPPGKSMRFAANQLPGINFSDGLTITPASGTTTRMDRIGGRGPIC